MDSPALVLQPSMTDDACRAQRCQQRHNVDCRVPENSPFRKS
jgi:hypothetical protein